MAKKTQGTRTAEAVLEAVVAAPSGPVLDVQVGPDMSVAANVKIDVQQGGATILVDEGQESQVLSFRGAEYHLPKSIVSSPLPTLTFRHLEKVTVYAFAGKREKVESAIKRAIASAIDTASLVKIACVAHSEGFHDDASIALFKAVKCAKKDQVLKGLAQSISAKLGYQI